MKFDLFSVVWLSIVAFGVFWNIAWGWDAIKTGTAKTMYRIDFSRVDQPFQFWMLLIARAFGMLIFIAFFVEGLDFIKDVQT